MKTSQLLLLTGLLALLPLNALADGGRECVFDPGTGMFVPPNGSGACFGDLGFSVVVAPEASGDLILAGNPAGENQWFRNNPNGKGRFHASTDVVFLAYCSPTTVATNACNPFSGEAFIGAGNVKLNADQQDLFFTCPFTARIRGGGVDGFGNEVKVTAALTTVPDANLGCRATVSSITASPVVD